MTQSNIRTFGLLHPGAMGASVGAAANGLHRVLWASDGRSDATRERAATAALEEVETLGELLEKSDVVVSVVPPGAALALAERVAGTDFAGIYVDANAVSPDTARRIAAAFAATEASVVDGGITGPPAWRPGTTRLHLSGERAAEVAACFAGSPLEAKVVDGPVGAASALKMTFAAYTKGTTALLAAVHAVAQAEGVDADLLAEWEHLTPDLPGRLRAGVPGAARRAWRFVAEMEQIAETFEAAGLPGGFHRAAAEIYSRLEDFRDAPEPPDPDSISRRLRGQ